MSDYEINSIEDVLKIPEDYIVDFLVDLHKWYEQRKIIDAIAEDTAKLMIEAGADPKEVYVDGKNVMIQAGPLVWKNDGMSGGITTLYTDDEPVFALDSRMREPNDNGDVTL